MTKAPPGGTPAPRIVQDEHDYEGWLLTGGLRALFGVLWAAFCLLAISATRDDDTTARVLLSLFIVAGGWRTLRGIGIVLATLRERARASPGELEVSEWPLGPGNPVRCRLVRRLKRPFEAASAEVRIGLCLLQKRSPDRPDNRGAWVTIGTREQGVTDVRTDGGVLRAHWELDLSEFEPLLAFPEFPVGPSPQFRWVLSVAVTGEDGTCLDSTFELDCDPAPERRTAA